MKHEFCVTFANSGEEVNCTTEVTTFLFRKERTETIRSWEQVEADAATLSGAKTLINQRKVLPKNVEILCFTASQFQKNCKGALFLRKFPGFLDVSADAQLSGKKVLVDHKKGFDKKISKTFCLQEKFAKGPVWCIFQFLVSENCAKRGYHDF